MHNLRVFLNDTEQVVADQDFESLEEAKDYLKNQIEHNFRGFTIENPSGWPGVLFYPWYRISSIDIIEIKEEKTGSP